MLSRRIKSLFLLLIVVSGCAETNRTDLVTSGAVTIERQKASKAYIAWSNAYQEEGSLVITGALNRRDHLGWPIKTHVDVTIISPDGTILDQARSPDIFVPVHLTGRSYQSLRRFKFNLPIVPVRGSVIRLVSHSGKHDDATNHINYGE